MILFLYNDNIRGVLQVIKRENKMTHDQIWNAIEEFAREHGMSCSGLAKHSGLDATTFNKSKRFSKYHQPRWPSTYSIAKIITGTGSQPQDFFKYITDEETEEKPS